eukprot:jgi/Astpho2/7933/Aster-06407
MAGPSPSQLDQHKQQLDRVTRLAGEELCKGARRDKDLVTQLQMQAETLTAQIKLIPSDTWAMKLSGSARADSGASVEVTQGSANQGL